MITFTCVYFKKILQTAKLTASVKFSIDIQSIVILRIPEIMSGEFHLINILISISYFVQINASTSLQTTFY